MAKWGEGDPRWIVEQRADGTNVNNWHWTEKNATEWSKTRLRELLTNLAFEDASGSCRTTEVTSIEGEASANNRKAKLIFFYEFVVKLKWKGKTADDTALSGTIEIPNLSEENDTSDIDVVVKLTEAETPALAKVKNLMHTQGSRAIRDQIGRWIKDLRTEYAQNLILPVESPGGAAAAAPASAAAPAPKPAAAALPQQKGPAKTDSTAVGTVEVSDVFKCSAADLFTALVDEHRVQAYTQSEAHIDSKVGGVFSLFGGNVTGTFKELVPYERLVMAWRFKAWTEGHFSEVVISLKESDGDTRLDLLQTGVPAADIERTREGWRMHQFERMKMVLGFGSGLNFSF